MQKPQKRQGVGFLTLCSRTAWQHCISSMPTMAQEPILQLASYKLSPDNDEPLGELAEPVTPVPDQHLTCRCHLMQASKQARSQASVHPVDITQNYLEPVTKRSAWHAGAACGGWHLQGAL